MAQEGDRRAFLAATVAATMAGACRSRESPAAPEPAVEPVAEPSIVRVASVKTAVEGQLLPALIAAFERTSSYRVRLTTGTEVYDLARDGHADMVISHYGHRDAERFVLDGLGEWPRTIFSNQMALVGPPDDPARVRDLDDLAEAFRRIVDSGHKLLVNDIDGVEYLTEILWNATGKPDRARWRIDGAGSKDAAMRRAAELGAYSLWGLTPFLRLVGREPIALEPLVLADPLLQRMMVSVVVVPGGARRVNTLGAAAFQAHLLSPATQAAIRTVRYPGKHAVSWVPAGRHNRSAMLPKG